MTDPATPAEPDQPVVVVCQGRMCSSRNASNVAQQLVAGGIPTARGGCYGLCDWGVNVVVRRGVLQGRQHQLQILDDDDVYCGVTVEDVATITTIAELPVSWAARRFDPNVHPSSNPIAERIARVRMRRHRA